MMIKELTAKDKNMINCFAFQYAEQNVSTEGWSEDIANMYLNLVNAEPELFRDLLIEDDGKIKSLSNEEQELIDDLFAKERGSNDKELYKIE